MEISLLPLGILLRHCDTEQFVFETTETLPESEGVVLCGGHRTTERQLTGQ